jgi:hypothetical protein
MTESGGHTRKRGGEAVLASSQKGFKRPLHFRLPQTIVIPARAILLFRIARKPGPSVFLICSPNIITFLNATWYKAAYLKFF